MATVLQKRKRVGRLQLGITVLKHSYPTGISDRWVVQTSVVYDRKEKP